MKLIMESWREYILEKYKRVGLNEDTNLTRRDFLKKTAGAAGAAGMAALGAKVLGAEEEEEPPPEEEHETSVYMKPGEIDVGVLGQAASVLTVAPLKFTNGDPVTYYWAPVNQSHWTFKSTGYLLSVSEQDMERLLEESSKLKIAYTKVEKILVDKWPLVSVNKEANIMIMKKFAYHRDAALPMNKIVQRRDKDPNEEGPLQFHFLPLYFTALRKIFKLKVDKFTQEIGAAESEKDTDEVLFNNGLYKMEEAFEILETADMLEGLEAKMTPFDQLNLPQGKQEFWEMRDGERYIDGKYNPPSQH